MGCVKFGYKSCVVFLGLLQLIVAIGLLVAGVGFFVTFGNVKQFAQNTMTLVPVSILISAAVFLFILAIFGICGAFKENKCMLAVFFVLSGALFVLELAGASLALALRGNFESAVQNEFEIFMGQYDHSDVVKKEVDWIQEYFVCCGYQNATDWLQLNISIPTSCCTSNSTLAKNCTSDAVINAHITGCGAKLHDKFFANLNIVGGVGLAFAFIQVLALIAVLCLICRRQEHYEVF